jgi:hypothetical protein
MKKNQYYNTLPEQVQQEKQKQYYTAEQVQNPKQTILHCRNRYKIQNKQYYTAGTGTK